MGSELVDFIKSRLNKYMEEVNDFVDFINKKKISVVYKVYEMEFGGDSTNREDKLLYAISSDGSYKSIELNKLEETRELNTNFVSISSWDLKEILDILEFKKFWKNDLIKLSKNERLVYCMPKYLEERVSLAESYGNKYYLDYEFETEIFRMDIYSEKVNRVIRTEYNPTIITAMVKSYIESLNI